MTSPAIRVEHLGKRYQIGAVQARYKTIRESLVNLVKMPRKKLVNQDSNHIWALKDVSFEVQPGEVVGIIGRNGAGKSTLLKVLAHITGPTEGRVEIHGRIGSLLEVGTGFHPELTGRENIYLNGAVLGMKRVEIDRKFDEIVDFAEIAEFLDTPVKHYSSGMYMRLAFAVAAHLEPEILLVDEVLAVGDAAFQKKCLGKMGDVAQEGRTVLFVSHNMGAIQRLCPQSIWIDGGKLIRFGPTDNAVHAYLDRSSETNLSGQMDLSNWPNRYGSGEARILSARILDDNFNITTTVYRAGFMAVEFTFQNRLAKPLHYSIVVMSDTGEKILHLSYYDTPGVNVDSLIGRYKARFSIPAIPLCSGNYCFALGIHTQNLFPIDVVLDVLPFIAEDMIDSPRPYKTVNEYAYCWTPNYFSIEPVK
jgi:lipopolysaccharide transport system ATP-binding protein